MSYERVGEQKMAAVKAAAEAWEDVRTGRKQAPNHDWQKVKARFHAYARADVVLPLIDEVTHWRRSATGATPPASLLLQEKSTPEGGNMQKKTPTKRATKRTGTKSTKRKTAPKVARAKKPSTKAGAK